MSIRVKSFYSIVYSTPQIKYNNLKDISSSVAENSFHLELFSSHLASYPMTVDPQI